MGKKYSLVIHAPRVCDYLGGRRNVYIGVRGGKIETITDSPIGAGEADEAYDAPNGSMVFPGFVDPHGHFRDWDLAHKETYATGSRAAAAHGITTAAAMPNTKPPISNPDALKANAERAGMDSLVDMYFWAGTDECTETDALREMAMNPRVCGEKIFAEQLYDDEVGRRLKAWASVWDGMVRKRAAIHCEDRGMNEGLEARYKQSGEPWAFSLSRPAESEALSIEKAFAARAGITPFVPLHVLHVSSRMGLDAFHKLHTQFDTCETAPHYLMFSMEDMRTDPRLKMKPPLKSYQDRDYLRGRLDYVTCIGTDHAPHAAGEKQGKWETNIPGIPVYDAYSGAVGFLMNGLGMKPMNVARLCSWGPAYVMGLSDRGNLAVGNRADFAVFDPDYEWTLDKEGIRSKCGWSPWEGRKFKGRTIATFREGVCIAREKGGQMLVASKPGDRLEV